jgi:PRTRC genetic system protein A
MSLETTIFDMGVTDTTTPNEKENKPSRTVQTVTKKPPVEPPKPVLVQGDWVIHFATERFTVADFVNEIPEEGVPLETVRQGIERHFPKFSAARTKWDVDEENKRLFPDAFAGSKGSIVLGEGRLAPSFFINVTEAKESNSVYRYLLSNDGKVFAYYESLLGVFIAPKDPLKVDIENKLLELLHIPSFQELPETYASSFEWKLPKIPNSILKQIVTFFRQFMLEEIQYEVALRVYWDIQNQQFIVDCPLQKVSPVAIQFEQMEQYSGINASRYIPVLEVHSHNVMRAFFSKTDDENEQSFNTSFGVFGVFGRLNREPYEMVFRAKFNDVSIDIDASEIFELEETTQQIIIPDNWKNNVKVKRGFYL